MLTAKILAADDEPGVRYFIKETLCENGYQVTTVESGQAALDIIKTLSGLIPICAWCGKKVCDDTDQWISLETYIEARSEAKFSHGICPDCLKMWRKKDRTWNIQDVHLRCDDTM